MEADKVSCQHFQVLRLVKIVDFVKLVQCALENITIIHIPLCILYAFQQRNTSREYDTMLFFRPTQDVLQISNTLRYSHLYLEKRDLNMRVLHVLIDLPTARKCCCLFESKRG